MTFHEKSLIDEKFSDPAGREDAYRRLDSHEPLAYILGEWYFYDERYIVTPDVLVPQPDTEILVEQAIKLIPENSLFVDLCTGSGCIAVSVLCHRPDLRAYAVDISDEALAIARENAEINGVSDRIEFVCDDIMYGTFELPPYSALLSNPPYIRSGVIPTLAEEVRAEPLIALDGGDDGLSFYRRIKELYDGGQVREALLFLEIGYDQAEDVKGIFGGGQVKKDYGGNDRLFML